MADVDLIDLLSADHGNLLAAGPQTVVSQVSQHLAVERELLYPAIRHHCREGGRLVDGLREADRALEERLAELESDPTPESGARLDEAIRDHVASLERLFPRLRREIPVDRLVEAVETVPWSIGGAPTHPHPRLAGNRLGEVVEEDLASVSNHVRDRAHDRKP